MAQPNLLAQRFLLPRQVMWTALWIRPLPAPDPPHLGLPEQSGGDAVSPAEPSVQFLALPVHAGATPLAPPGPCSLLQRMRPGQRVNPDPTMKTCAQLGTGPRLRGTKRNCQGGDTRGPAQAGVEAQPARAEGMRRMLPQRRTRREGESREGQGGVWGSVPGTLS